MSERLTSAELIRRFREEPPKSREQRQQSGKPSGSLWWEKSLDEEVPRELPTKAVQSAKPSAVLSDFRKPVDYVSSERPSTDVSFDFDDMINRDIDTYTQRLRGHTRDSRASPQRINLRESYDLNSSMDRGLRSRDASPTFRFGAARNNGGIRDYNISPFQSRDFGRASVETLGSTGFKGLLTSDLKLDGRREAEELERERQAKAAEAEAATKGSEHLKTLNAGLEDLMKSLHAAGHGMNKEDAASQQYLPEGVAQSIPQVGLKLAADMLDFRARFGDRHREEDEESRWLGERDARMREEGRREERERGLLSDWSPGVLPGSDRASAAAPTGIRVSGGLIPHHSVVGAPHPSAVRDSAEGPLAAVPPTAASVDSAGSPFPMLGEGSAPHSRMHREGFPVGNDVTQVAHSRKADNAAKPHLHPAEQLSAQQMRELSGRLRERTEQLQALYGHITGEGSGPLMDGVAASPGKRSAPGRAMHPQPQPQYQPFIAHPQRHVSPGRIINPYPPPTHILSPQHPHLTSIYHQYQPWQPQQPPDYYGPPPQQYPGGVLNRIAGGESTGVTDAQWEPEPPIEHKTVYSAARAIDSALGVAMDVLHRRLPPDAAAGLSLADRIRLSMANKEAQQQQGEERREGVAAAAAQSMKPPAAVSASSPVDARAEVAGQLAASLVNSILPQSAPAATVEAATIPPSVNSSCPPSARPADSDATAAPAPVDANVDRPVANKTTFGLRPASAPSAAKGSAAPGEKSRAEMIADMDGVLGPDHSYRVVWDRHAGKVTVNAPAAKKQSPASAVGIGAFIQPPPSSAEAREIMRPTTSSAVPLAKPAAVPITPLTDHAPFVGDTGAGSVDQRTLRGLQSIEARPISTAFQAAAPQFAQAQSSAPPLSTQFSAPPMQYFPEAVNGANPGYSSRPTPPPPFVAHPYPQPVQPQWVTPKSGQGVVGGVGRAVEGSAMQHLRAARVLQDRAGQLEQEQHVRLQLQNEAALFGSPASHKYLLPPPSSVSPVSVAAAYVPAASSGAASLHEREAQLRRMQAMRRAMMG